jgi:hypothetical protein
MSKIINIADFLQDQTDAERAELATIDAGKQLDLLRCLPIASLASMCLADDEGHPVSPYEALKRLGDMFGELAGELLMYQVSVMQRQEMEKYV